MRVREELKLFLEIMPPLFAAIAVGISTFVVMVLFLMMLDPIFWWICGSR